MPWLDPTDGVLPDPDFWDTLSCLRSNTSTSEQGLTQLAQSTFSFIGIVTSDRGLILERMAAGEHASGSILVVTRFRLRDSGSGATADIVTWNGLQYTVVRLNDYSRFGPGFVQAICELLPLHG